jgi:hypothetical protein
MIDIIETLSKTISDELGNPLDVDMGQTQTQTYKTKLTKPKRFGLVHAYIYIYQREKNNKIYIVSLREDSVRNYRTLSVN